MARPKKDAPLDLTQGVDLTAGAIERLTCPPGKQQAFLRDLKAPGLRVRVTASGLKAFVFEAKLNRQTIRRTLGDVRAWSIEDARVEANRLRVTLDSGDDPRALEREQAERKAAEQAAQAKAQADLALTAGDVWAHYLEERRPRWGERNYRDHLAMGDAGGATKLKGVGVTKPGPLAPLLALRMADLTTATVEAWAAREAAERPARVRLALRLLKAFLRWADADPRFQGRADPTAASARKAREAAGKAKAKDDVLERTQLAAWFEKVRGIMNPVIGAYLQTLLLTGARPGEVLSLRWEDINSQWKSIAIRDKVEGERQIPLTPYVWHLLQALPRRNEWVFSSVRTLATDEKNSARRERRYARQGSEAPEGPVSVLSASGRIVDPSIAHRKACATAGLDGLTLHGLRRSFASLTEWLEIPAGVVAQIQGHKPSATAEKHYKRRPLDLLRVHHERIEAWILEQAGVKSDPALVGLHRIA
jgi:integrase